MLDIVNRFFGKSVESNPKNTGQEAGHNINVAACCPNEKSF
ncbi:MAG: hypothetical protein R6W88_08240 [Desulfobacterales bacterium]